jgi:signal transduction histidine kinase
MEQATFPNFRPCQFVLSKDGTILGMSGDAASRISSPKPDIRGNSLREVLLGIESSWSELLPEEFSKWPEEIFLPWGNADVQYAAGLSLNILKSGGKIFVTAAPSLLRGSKLEQASLQELPHDAATVGQLFLRLRTAESRLNNYLNNFPGVFFSQRPDFSFSYVGPGLMELIGADPRPILHSGSQFLDLIIKADQPQFLKEIERNSISSDTISVTYRVRNPVTKSIVHLMDVRTPRLSPGGLLLGYEGVWLDVTRQSIAEARLSRSAWKENLATITSGLIHDFSNVMAGIFSLSELYASTLEKNHPWRKGMTQIMESSRQARKLVRRIIDLNREEAGQKNYFNLETLISDQLDLIKAVMSKQTKIETDFTGEELPVYLDDVSFRQTILNLAINSRDAIEKNGLIRIKVRKAAKDEKLPDDSPAPEDGAIIDFSDNGCGIPEKYTARIWEPFFTTKEAGKGSGFGLYNAKLFVEQNKGRISVKSVVGKGTTFSIYIPLADFNEMVEQAESENAQPDRERKTVAILSGVDVSSFDLAQRMREKNWELIFFKRPEALRRYLREAPRRPDLFLTVLLGADTVDCSMITELRESSKGMLFALYAVNRNLEELPQESVSCMDAAIEDHTSPDAVVREIETLMNKAALKKLPVK